MINALPQQLRKDVRSTFIEALDAGAATPLLDMCATYLQSQSDREDYAWLDEVPNLVQFVDEVQFQSLAETAAAGFAAINVKYTGGLSFKRDDLADEKTGGMAMRIKDLAARAMMHADYMLADLLIAGTSADLVADGGGQCYDGGALFSASHSARGSSGSQSNLLTGTGTTTAQCQADLNSAIAALYNLKDFSGKPVNRGFKQFCIVYPPALNKALSEAVGAEVVSQTSNVQFRNKQITMVQEPLLTADSETDYYLCIADAPVRGIIYQEREGVSLEAQENPDSDDAFKREVYNYKVRKRAVAIPGQWRRIVKINNA